ncbi:uncharacterized protein METZ01_LOCUS373414, partial [marine metagenome]
VKNVGESKARKVVYRVENEANQEISVGHLVHRFSPDCHQKLVFQPLSPIPGVG